MATSPIYSWPEPDNTDLVKNGALAIRTLGNAIDTTMGTMVAKTVVDAKGDLIAGTAADTVARQAVGSNFAFLQADSAQSTGLVWNNAAWTSYTPTVTATSGTFTTVSASGKYIRVGKLCVTQFRVTITNNGTAAGQVLVTAPFTSNNSFNTAFVGAGRETNAVGFTVTPRIINNDSTFYITKIDGTYPGGTTYVLDNTVTFEVA
jgi:hypothetical protein